MLMYSKKYQNESEENDRMAIFLNNKKTIDEHNKRYEKGLETYNMGLNKYSDLSNEEFVKQMNGFKPPEVLQ